MGEETVEQRNLATLEEITRAEDEALQYAAEYNAEKNAWYSQAFAEMTKQQLQEALIGATLEVQRLKRFEGLKETSEGNRKAKEGTAKGRNLAAHQDHKAELSRIAGEEDTALDHAAQDNAEKNAFNSEAYAQMNKQQLQEALIGANLEVQRLKRFEGLKAVTEGLRQTAELDAKAATNAGRDLGKFKRDLATHIENLRKTTSDEDLALKHASEYNAEKNALNSEAYAQMNKQQLNEALIGAKLEVQRLKRFEGLKSVSETNRANEETAAKTRDLYAAKM